MSALFQRNGVRLIHERPALQGHVRIRAIGRFRAERISRPAPIRQSDRLKGEGFSSSRWHPRSANRIRGPCVISVCKASVGSDDSSTSDVETSDPAPKKEGSLLRVAASVGAVTGLCKALGMAREMLLAAFFGIGPVVDAYNYAQIIPGFFLSIVGGINGPCHTAVAATLGNKSKEEGAKLIEAISSLVGAALLVASIGILIFSGPLIDLAAPGLAQTSAVTRDMAAKQLAIMSPCAMLSGLLGVAFGSLSNAGLYLIPALSPALTSIMVIFTVVAFEVSGGAVTASLLLAIGFTAGAFLQWLVQTSAMSLAGISSPLRWRWLNPMKHEGMQQVLRVMFPAVVGSGMLQIATYIDLYFASFLPGAAAGLGYANLLAMAPLGVLSSSLLLPILPRFSRLAAPELRPQLRLEIRKAAIVALALGLPLAAMLVPVAAPIVRVVFERKAFNAAAGVLVTGLLQCYAIGAPVYLLRDVLVRAFYAQGDGNSPFWVSMAAIGMNALLDWYFITQIGLGAQGLVLATVLVNLASVVLLYGMLVTKIGSLRLREVWNLPVWILLSSGLAATTAHFTYERFAAAVVAWFTPKAFWVVERGALPVKLGHLAVWGADAGFVGLAALSGFLVFVALLFVFKSSPGGKEVWDKVFPPTEDEKLARA
eukprot:CAMPEP_0118925418 /NCGR_PEP_ID=MMETSP1169-20130426/3310_1 /TAXON_ID=36882 /ORGANISM="Pyramimonas obovata, Strain CCMP722" /LENGTH=652 /DNA_ID=CAMNT_0006866713 /DNA_START=178 /DNA_END=2136 /DNA_ORIENTATION=-